MLYIKKVTLENIRCFGHAELEFDLGSDSPPWTMLIGDNATGKTTLLKAMALGLCDSSSAAGLLRESDLGYIREGATSASILLEFEWSGNTGHTPPWTKTKIVRGKDGELDQLQQEVSPDFPWVDVFACAYGAGRGIAGAGDVGGYSVINSVYSLFNYSEGLQNPELSMRRLEDDQQRSMEELLANVMGVESVKLGNTGLTVSGWWGEGTPYRDLADAYKASLLWVSDMLGWAWMHSPDLKAPQDVIGIVLVDEIEQHLHPKLQLKLVDLLKDHFPRVQFVSTTHSPLVASSLGVPNGPSPDRLIHLGRKVTGDVAITPIETMHGWRSDEVLESVAFDWLVQFPFDRSAIDVKESGTVHILFADIAGSVAKNFEIGDAAWAQVWSECRTILDDAAIRHNGNVVKHTGDGAMVSFPAAADAVTCAIKIQRAMRVRNQSAATPVSMKIGIETGEPVQEAGTADLIGRSVNVAARLCQEAAGGEILVSSLVAGIVEPRHNFRLEERGPVPLKGLRGEHTLHSVRWQ